jgi:hypothetical protein
MRNSFTINSPDIQRLQDDLEFFARRSIPFATKKALNDSAFAARAIAQADIRASMTTRNQFTARSVRVTQANTLRISRQAAIVGSIADYMADQEFGAVQAKTGNVGVAIPTSFAAGQGEARLRTRLPRRANKLSNIQLSRGRNRSQSRAQRNIVAIRRAAASGRKFVFLDLQRSKGIFKVTGGQRRPKIKMVYDLSRQSVVIPANPWLRPAFNEAITMQPAFYADALRFQARRHGLFR